MRVVEHRFKKFDAEFSFQILVHKLFLIGRNTKPFFFNCGLK